MSVERERELLIKKISQAFCWQSNIIMNTVCGATNIAECRRDCSGDGGNICGGGDGGAGSVGSNNNKTWPERVASRPD